MHKNDFTVPNKTLLAALNRENAPNLPPIPPEFLQFTPIVDKYLGSDSTGHDTQHAFSVLALALRIQEKEGGDRYVIGIAALLHDLLRPWELQQKRDGLNRENITSHFHQEALDIIRSEMSTIDIEENCISQVVSLIAEHENYENQTEDITTELKILQDADRLEAIGNIGIARTFMFAGAYADPLVTPGESLQITDRFKEDHSKKGGSAIEHFYHKTLKLHETMHTETAKKIAVERTKRMQAFIALLFEEMEGIS